MTEGVITSGGGLGAWRRPMLVFARVRPLITAELDRQAPRAFAWAVVAFAAGIVVFFTWRTDPHALVGPAVITAGAALAVAARHYRGLRWIAFAMMAFGAGHTAADLRSRIQATPVLTHATTAQEIHGRVVQAEFRPTSHRVVLDQLTVPGLAPAETPVRVRVTVPAKNGLPRVGDHIVVRAVLRAPLRPEMPDGFEFQRVLYFAQIGATGFTIGPWVAETAAPVKDTLADRLSARLEKVRRRIADRTRQAIADPGDATTTAALIMGEQTAIPEDLQEAYRKSGLAHLLSISGVHMSLLAAAVFFLVRRGLALVPFLALRLDTKKIAAWTSLGATALYTLISGLSVPAERSFLMIAVVMIAVLLDRTAISIRTIAWAALVLMAIYPDAVIGASFQMSFMAVLALIALAEHVRLKVRWRGPSGEIQILHAIGVILAAAAATDIAASGSTALYAIYHFNRFPTYSIVSNFFADPITGFWVMPWGLIAMLAMPFGLDQVPLALMGKGVGLCNAIARTVGGWPGSQVHVPPMSPIALAIGSLGLLMLCLWQSRFRFVGLVLFAAAVTQPWLATPPDVLIADTADVMAISAAHGQLVIRPGRGEAFTRDVWKDRYGVATDDTWTATGDAKSGLRCDSEGCILARNGRRVLIAFTPDALAQDCHSVDAALSLVPSRAFCRGTPTADVFDLRRRGAVALRTTAQGIAFRYALDRVGDRRWSPSRKPPPKAAAEPEPEERPNTAAADPPADPEP